MLHLVKSKDYGLREAIFHPRNIDKWCRYADIVNEIKKEGEGLLVLDVGAGGRGISEYLDPSKYTILVLDVLKELFVGTTSTKGVQPIIGDGARLPFKDKSVDLVVSAATLEHVPKWRRDKLLGELKRVCKRKLILHSPTESEDGLFKSKEYDIKYLDAHKRILGFEDPYGAEHVKMGHPTIDEIRKIFPQAKIMGRKNCDVWLKYIILSRRPFFGYLAGLAYCFIWKKKDNKPPYYESMVVYTKKMEQVS